MTEHKKKYKIRNRIFTSKDHMRLTFRKWVNDKYGFDNMESLENTDIEKYAVEFSEYLETVNEKDLTEAYRKGYRQCRKYYNIVDD